MNATNLTRRAVLAGAAAGVLPPWAWAADKVLKLVVGFPPGGAIDTTARVYSEALKLLGTAVVENRPGAAGNIAASTFAQSPPDGNTIMLAPVNVYCISQALYSKLAFNASKDFDPVGIVATFPWAIAVHPSIPVGSIAELVVWAKANPGKAQCGMAATGSEGHLMAYSFAKATGMPMEFIAYKGGAPMSQDLMAGHIPMAFDPIVNLAPPHKAGKVRVLAVTGTKRSIASPDTPTFEELGHRSMTGETWIGASMRQGTPSERIQTVSAALNEAAKTEAVRSKLAMLGLEARTGTPQAMASQIASDTKTYGALVQALGLKLE